MDAPAPDGAPRISRRRLLQGGVAAGTALMLPLGRAAHAAPTVTDGFDRTGDGWGPDWQIDGVANLLLEDGRGILQSGTDIYPADQRAVAFLVDHRFRDGEIEAVLHATGVAAGTVLRRTGPRAGYLALYGTGSGILQLLARTQAGETVVAAGEAPTLQAPVTIRLEAAGANPTTLTATVAGAAGGGATVEGTDATAALQAGGDPGLVATAETGFPSGPDTPPMVASSRAVFVTDAGDDLEAGLVGGLKDEVYRELSTAVVEEVTITTAEDVATTTPSVVAAVTGPPAGSGARVSVVSDVPARVDLEVATRPDFGDATVVPRGDTNRFRTLLDTVAAAGDGRETFWRPVLRRGDRTATGPTRRFNALPAVGDGGEITLAIGGCGTEFKGFEGSVFDLLADLDPDVFAWIGDLNYPDSHGSLSQTMSGYEGIWHQFLAAPPLTPVFERAAFVPQRDDHDYGRNDLTADTIPDHGAHPWEGIMAPRPFYSFAGGLGAAWVVDTRRFKDPADLPDTPEKSLLGHEQRRWLLDGLAASQASFNLVLSPNPVWLPTNNETCWGRGYTAERELLLDHVAADVDGTVLFVTADSHAAAVIERDGFVEMRPCPIELPAAPGWHDAASGEGVLFSEQGESYLALLTIGEVDGTPTLDATLLRGNGSTAWQRTLTAPRVAPAPDAAGTAAGDGADAASPEGGSDRSALPATGGGAAAVGATLLGGAAALHGSRPRGGDGDPAEDPGPGRGDSPPATRGG